MEKHHKTLVEMQHLFFPGFYCLGYCSIYSFQITSQYPTEKLEQVVAQSLTHTRYDLILKCNSMGCTM